jgi:hypothetical protein
LKGTYVAVEPFHLDRYIDEQVFRYNNRATKENPLTDADRFSLALTQIANKRLTYAELTGKNGRETVLDCVITGSVVRSGLDLGPLFSFFVAPLFVQGFFDSRMRDAHQTIHSLRELLEWC